MACGTEERSVTVPRPCCSVGVGVASFCPSRAIRGCPEDSMSRPGGGALSGPGPLSPPAIIQR